MFNSSMTEISRKYHIESGLELEFFLARVSNCLGYVLVPETGDYETAVESHEMGLSPEFCAECL
jgi:hypothetical protein